MAAAASPLLPTSVTLVSPLSQPLWTRSFPPSPQADLAHTHLAFAALDYVDAAVAAGSGVGGGREGYLGLLLVLDGEAVCVPLRRFGSHPPPPLRQPSSTLLSPTRLTQLLLSVAGTATSRRPTSSSSSRCR